MLNLLLILLGLISNPNSNSSNCGNDGSATTAVAQPNLGDTGGETGQVPPRK